MRCTRDRMLQIRSGYTEGMVTNFNASVAMFRRSHVFGAAAAVLHAVGGMQTAVGTSTSGGSAATGVAAAVVAPMIVADNRKAAERDALLASAPMNRCSGCHREILPFTNLPVLRETHFVGADTTEVNSEWTEKEVATIQWHRAGSGVAWTKVKIYSRDKGKIRRFYAYEEPYQPTRFFLPADGGENPHKVLED